MEGTAKAVGGLHFGSARHLKKTEGQAQITSLLPGKISVVFSWAWWNEVEGTSEVQSTVARALVACTLEVPAT